MVDPNLALLSAMALALGPLRERLVFVGGCATGLLLTNPAAAGVRPTEDVDAIVEVASLAGYHALHPQLSERGFRQTMEDNTPPFRWYWNRMQLDLVPVDEHSAGLCKPLVPARLCCGRDHRAGAGADAAPPGRATLRGHQVRGLQRPWRARCVPEPRPRRHPHVVDGRAELVAELAQSGAEVRGHVVAQVRALLAHPELLNALPGIVAPPNRAGVVLERLQRIATLSAP